MAAVQPRKLVHKQFNSPMGLYSQQNVNETLNRELKAFGSDGIEIDDQLSRSLNLANSAVLRAVEEEEQQQMKCGYKRVAWPPASEERIVREFTPQPQTQFQPATAYTQQPTAPAGAGASAVPPTQGPIYNNVPQHQYQQQQQSHQHTPNTNANNFASDTNHLPYEQNSKPNQNGNEYEAFPPQTPETPIILKDKQFSRLPSHEPNQTNSVPYQHQHQQYQQQQQQQHQHTQQYQQPQVQQQYPQPQTHLDQQQFYRQQQPQSQPQYQQPQHNHQQQHQQQYQEQPHQQQQQHASYPPQQQQQPQHQDDYSQNQQTPSGWKPIRPPQTKPENLFTSGSGVRETAPSVATPIYQQQYQNLHQQQQYRAPSFDNYQQPQQQQQQYQQPPQQQYQQAPPQPQYQAQAQAPYQPPQPQYQAQAPYQQPPQVGSQYQQPPQQQQYQQPAWAHQQPQAQQPQQQQYQQPPWVQQQQQPQQQQYQQQQPQYQNPSNQYNQAPHYQQPPPQQQQQYPSQQQQNQFVPQTNQQHFNSYSQPQQQQHTVSHDQVDQQQYHHHQVPLAQDQRGASPGIITLRKEAPITQKPAPVYTSQPAAVSYRESSTDSLGGSSMRGDLKWPPPEYKEAAAKENEERRQLALGPVCRPRKINRDYTPFFAKNALSHHYPSYKVPPGTQHMIN